MSADAGTPRAACELLALARHRLAQGQFDPLLADDIARFLAGGRKRSAVETADLLRAVEIPPNHVAAMEAQTGGRSPNEAVADAMVAAGFAGSRWAATTTNRLGAETPDRVIAHEAGGDHPADDPRLHQEAVDCALADELVEIVDEFEEAIQVVRANRQHRGDVLGLHDSGAPEPAILPAPPRPHITRKRLVEIVEGAFRFDDIHVTALRIGEHVVKRLGIEIVEEG